MVEARLDFTTGEWECPKCGRHFPTHYRLRDSSLRRQFGRRYVASSNNVRRHVEACKLT